MDLPDRIKKKLIFLAAQARDLAALAQKPEVGETGRLEIDLAVSALALTALVTADELADQKELKFFLQCGELSWRVREIAFLCLDVQETDDREMARALIRTVGDRIRSIAEFAELPECEPPAGPEPTHTELAPAGRSTTALQLTPEEPDGTETLRAEIHALRELLASLVAERDNLINVVLRDIEAAYMRELGGLEAEAYRAECEARVLKAKLERLQAELNREETVRTEEVDEAVRSEYEAYQKFYEEFVRRINDAMNYSRQREQQKTAQTSHEQEQENADAPGSETEEQELKRLYRKIVKAMHPDLHPDQDDATKDLFKRAIRAYKEFDLQLLREIAAMLDSEAEMQGENAAEGLAKEKARLLELIHKVRAEIRRIKSRYPYTLKALLDDPIRLEEAKNKQKARIRNAKRAAKAYQTRITEIIKRYG